MARGWESKSVEAQAQEAQSSREQPHKEKRTAQEAELIRRKEVLTLAITRVRKQLESATEPRYREQLLDALAALETQLAERTS
jgi:TATA-binding protein-associated factor Taf7